MRISDWSSDVCSSDLLSLSAFQREHRPPPRPVPPSFCCPNTRRPPDVPGPWGHRTRWGLPSILPQLLGARTSFTQEPKPDTGPVWRTAPYPPWSTTSSVVPDPIRRRRRPEGSPARTGGLNNGSDPARPDTDQIRQLSGRSSGNSRGGFTHL